jgi:hypothetical protein
MAIRSLATVNIPKIRPDMLDAARPTEVPPQALSDGHPAAFYLSMRCPTRYRMVGFTQTTASPVCKQPQPRDR